MLSDVVETDVVIGCDGSASAIRSEMLKGMRFNFSQQYLDYGYKELTIPAGPDRKHALETNALHIWPRGNYMLIALPNIDGTFACILFLPFEGQDSFAELASPQVVHEFFECTLSRCSASHAPTRAELLREPYRRNGHHQMFALARSR